MSIVSLDSSVSMPNASNSDASLMLIVPLVSCNRTRMWKRLSAGERTTAPDDRFARIIGAFRPECREDRDCPGGFECQEQRCLAPECRVNADCPPSLSVTIMDVSECRNAERTETVPRCLCENQVCVASRAAIQLKNARVNRLYFPAMSKPEPRVGGRRLSRRRCMCRRSLRRWLSSGRRLSRRTALPWGRLCRRVLMTDSVPVALYASMVVVLNSPGRIQLSTALRCVEGSAKRSNVERSCPRAKSVFDTDVSRPSNANLKTTAHPRTFVRTGSVYPLRNATPTDHVPMAKFVEMADAKRTLNVVWTVIVPQTFRVLEANVLRKVNVVQAAHVRE